MATLSAQTNNRKKAQISKGDFQFRQVGHGRYLVTYTSPVIFKEWSRQITDMDAINAVNMYDYPTKSAMNELKRLVKQTLS